MDDETEEVYDRGETGDEGENEVGDAIRLVEGYLCIGCSGCCWYCWRMLVNDLDLSICWWS